MDHADRNAVLVGAQKEIVGTNKRLRPTRLIPMGMFTSRSERRRSAVCDHNTRRKFGHVLLCQATSPALAAIFQTHTRARWQWMTCGAYCRRSLRTLNAKERWLPDPQFRMCQSIASTPLSPASAVTGEGAVVSVARLNSPTSKTSRRDLPPEARMT